MLFFYLLLHIVLPLLHALDVGFQHLNPVSRLCYLALQYDNLLLGLLQLLSDLGTVNLNLVSLLAQLVDFSPECSFVSLRVLLNCF